MFTDLIELPSRDETPSDPLDAWDELQEHVEDERLELDGLKVGGWPSTIQGAVS